MENGPQPRRGVLALQSDLRPDQVAVLVDLPTSDATWPSIFQQTSAIAAQFFGGRARWQRTWAWRGRRPSSASYARTWQTTSVLRSRTSHASLGARSLARISGSPRLAARMRANGPRAPTTNTVPCSLRFSGPSRGWGYSLSGHSPLADYDGAGHRPTAFAAAPGTPPTPPLFSLSRPTIDVSRHSTIRSAMPTRTAFRSTYAIAAASATSLNRGSEWKALVPKLPRRAALLVRPSGDRLLQALH